MNNKQLPWNERRFAAAPWLVALLLALPAPAWAVVANDDGESTLEDTAVVIDVLANDLDQGDPPLSVVSTTAAGNGSVVINGDDTITYTPDPEFFGSDSFDYTIQDFSGDPATATVSVNVTSVNDAPSFTPGGDVTVDEDAGPQSQAWATAIDLGPSNEGQTASFNVSNDNNGLFSTQPAIAPDGTLTFTPAGDVFGTSTVTVSLSDGVDTTADVTFDINVTAVNDAPSFTPGGDVTVDEDAGPQSQMWATAIDLGPANESQTASFNVSNDNNGLFSTQPAIAPDGTLTFTPAGDAFGTSTVTVSLSDGVDTTADVTFDINVTSVNDAPSFTPGGDVTVDEDAGLQSQLWATAIDLGPANEGQTASFNVSNDNNGLFSTQPAIAPDGTLTFTPAGDAFGTSTVTVSLSDGVDTTADVTFDINVTAVNDAPSFTPGGDVTVDEDAGLQSQMWATAIDLGPANEGQTASFNVSNDTPGLFSAQPAIASDGTLTFTPAPEENGTATVTVSLTDGVDTTADVTFDINVTAVNDAPSFTPGGDVTVDEDAGPQSQMWATAIDLGPANESQTASFNVSNDNNGLFSTQPAIAPDGTLTFTPAAQANGTATVTVSLSDGVDTTPDETFAINVASVNDEPGFTAGGDQTVLEDSGPATVSGWATGLTTGPPEESTQSLSFNVTNDNNALFSSQPAVAPDGTLTFTPAADANGTANVTVSVSDDGGTANGGDDTSPDQTFTIDVTAVNDQPSYTSGGNVGIGEDAGPQSMVWASGMSPGPADEAGQTLSFNIVTIENGGLFSTSPTVDPVTGVLTFEAQPDANGLARVTLNLSDDGGTANGGVDTTPDETFEITVGLVNDPPVVVDEIDDVTVDEDAADEVIDLSGTFDDVDIATNGDSLTYSVSGVSGDAVFTSATTSGSDVVLDFAPDQHGTATVTVRATDSFGASVEDTFEVVVNPVNDAPVVANSVPDQLANEDGPDIVVDLSGVFDDVDIATNGDALTLDVTGNTNASLFDLVDLSGTTLTLGLAFDQNGNTTISITATDSEGLSVTDSFDVIIGGVNDIPAPEDDARTIDEDSGPILIDVLANDYLAEQPTTVVAAGQDGGSESDPVIVLDENDDPIGGANGIVTIVGNEVQYQPKADYYGTDFFTYTIRDANGDSGVGTVTVTVNPVNDPPRAPEQRSYSMLENGILEVEVADGLLFGAYDVEGARLGPDGLPLGSTLSILPQSLPAVGVVSIDNVTGEFTYTPPVDFTGEVAFTYRVTDGGAQSADYEARIVVVEAPEPPPPPPAGEVAVTFNLANVPLEQSTSVSPNVIIMMDDSGSMDWNMSVRGADAQGGFVTDGGRRTNTYYYLWDLDNNIFSPWSGNGRILPTEEALDAHGDTQNNQYGVWRARNHTYNRLYYNPEVQYTPWIGQDWNDNEFGDADPRNVRLNPRDPTNTFDLLDPHDYWADAVPDWQAWDYDDIFVNDVYIPYYYTSTGTPPLAWDDPHTKVEIRDDGTIYQGGPQREDCAAGDNDPTTCTYDQEIQNFANWFQYYRNREYAAKNGLGKVISQVQDIRVGYETINNNRSEPVREMNDLHTEGNKKLLMDDIYRTNSSGGTPLRRALARAGEMFEGDYGDDPLLPDPEGFCQQNFTLLFSDGYWNGWGPAQNNEDGDNDSVWDGGVYADGEWETLADVAMYYYERDLRPGWEDLVPASQRDRLGVPEGVFSGASPRMHQHMKTYTVAFGVVGDVDPTTLPVDPTVAFPWPDPQGSPQGKIDDMLHAAVNGRGQFLSAVNPQELQTALESAFLEFTQAASSTSAAAFNSTSLQEGTLLYRGFYDLRDFTGELSATLVNPDGTLSTTPEWRASQQLNPANKAPNDRVLITYDPVSRSGIPFRPATLTPDQQIVMNTDEVNYIRGQRGQEQPAGALRRRPTVDGLLGDIVNSSPVYVGTPRGLNRDQAPYPESDLFSEYAEDESGRQPMVYVGANDGILHGFDAMTGEELFGYVPNKIIDGSQNYHHDLDEFASPFYQHKYFVDLSPRVTDAYVRGSATAVGRSWNTVLLGGLGAGGKGFFALNVTNPESDFSSEANAQDVVLWEFTDEDDTSPSAALDPFGAPVKDLGYALSLPSVAMSNVPDTDGNEWVAIFGNGPNSTAGVAKLFVLFMDRGLDGWDPGDFIKLDTGRGVPVAPEQLAGYPNGLGTPALVDTDLNGTVDWVYAGDRLGNLYRFDLCNRDPATHECSGNPGDWTVTRLFTATYDEGGLERLQPILSQPLVVKHPTEDGFLVIFGTGSYMTREDSDNEEIQSIYAIWDRGESSPATAQNGSKYTRLVEQTLTNEVDDSVTPPMTRRALTSNTVSYEPDSPTEPGTYGWYVDLDMPRATNTISGALNTDSSGREPPSPQFPGEKAIRRLLLRNGAVITTTVLPSLDEFSCYGTRPGAILVLDAVTGGDVDRPVIDFNNDGEIDSDDLLEVGGEEYSAGLLFNQSDLDGALVDLSTLGGEGNTDWLFACGGNDCLPFRIEPPDESRTGRLSWRELDATN